MTVIDDPSRSTWWRGFVVDGPSLWIVAACLLAGVAQVTAMIPVAEPPHSRFAREADVIALELFAIVASPAVLALLMFAVWRGLRKR